MAQDDDWLTYDGPAQQQGLTSFPSPPVSLFLVSRFVHLLFLLDFVWTQWKVLVPLVSLNKDLFIYDLL